MKVIIVTFLLGVSLSMGVNAARNHTQSTDDTSSDETVYYSLEDFYDGNLYAAENLGMFKKFLVIGLGLAYFRAPATGTVFIPTDTAFRGTLRVLNITSDGLAVMPNMVDAVIRYHMAGVVYPTEAALMAAKTITTTYLKLSLRVSPSLRDGSTLVGGQSEADITMGPLAVNKGKSVLYVIDNVLLPPVAAFGFWDLNSYRPPPQPLAPPPPPAAGPGSNTGVIVGAVVGGTAAALLAVGAGVYMWRRQQLAHADSDTAVHLSMPYGPGAGGAHERGVEVAAALPPLHVPPAGLPPGLPPGAAVQPGAQQVVYLWPGAMPARI